MLGAVKKEAAQDSFVVVAGGGFSSKVRISLEILETLTEAGRGRGRGASGAATGGFARGML